MSLRCGHLFGLAYGLDTSFDASCSCIDRWISKKLKNEAKCPQCNAPCVKKDMRVLFAKCVKTMDTSQRDHALLAMSEERQKRQKCELQLARMRLSNQIMEREIKRLHLELETLRESIQTYVLFNSLSPNSVDSSSPPHKKSRNEVEKTFKLSHTIEISSTVHDSLLDYGVEKCRSWHRLLPSHRLDFGF